MSRGNTVNDIVFRERLTQPNRIVRLEVDKDFGFHLNGYEIKQWGNIGEFEVQASEPFASLSIDTGEFSPVGSASDNGTLLTMIYKGLADPEGWGESKTQFLRNLEGWSSIRELIHKEFSEPDEAQHLSNWER